MQKQTVVVITRVGAEWPYRVDLPLDLREDADMAQVFELDEA